MNLLYALPFCLTSILILSSYLQQGLPSDVLTSGLPQEKLLYIPRLFCSFYMPAYLALIESFTQTTFDEQYESLSSSLCSFFQSPADSFLLGPNIFLGTLFAYTLTLFLSLNPLNAELNPICHLLALLGGATIVVVSRLRVNVQDKVSIHITKQHAELLCLRLAQSAIAQSV